MKRKFSRTFFHTERQIERPRLHLGQNISLFKENPVLNGFENPDIWTLVGQNPIITTIVQITLWLICLRTNLRFVCGWICKKFSKEMRVRSWNTFQWESVFHECLLTRVVPVRDKVRTINVQCTSKVSCLLQFFFISTPVKRSTNSASTITRWMTDVTRLLERYMCYLEIPLGTLVLWKRGCQLQLCLWNWEINT